MTEKQTDTAIIIPDGHYAIADGSASGVRYLSAVFGSRDDNRAIVVITHPVGTKTRVVFGNIDPEAEKKESIYSLINTVTTEMPQDVEARSVHVTCNVVTPFSRASGCIDRRLTEINEATSTYLYERLSETFDQFTIHRSITKSCLVDLKHGTVNQGEFVPYPEPYFKTAGVMEIQRQESHTAGDRNYLSAEAVLRQKERIAATLRYAGKMGALAAGCLAVSPETDTTYVPLRLVADMRQKGFLAAYKM